MVKVIFKKVSPVVLINKLGRYLAISTATGDFYEISPQTHALLKEWKEGVSSLPAGSSRAEISALGRALNIPSTVTGLFPIPRENINPENSGNISACLTDLTLNLNSDCNLRCVYCWNDHGSYSNSRFLEGKAKSHGKNGTVVRMPVKTALRAVDTLVKLRGGDRNLVVDFYGGEPLLNLDTLMATVNYCRENQARWGVDFHFLLATNGTLLTPSIAQSLIDKGVQIAVSIDGPKAVHDNNRPFLDGSGSFEKILLNIKTMPKPLLKRLVGRTTVTPFFPDMAKLYEQLKKLGFERVEIFESEDACHNIGCGGQGSFFSTEENYRLLYKSYEKLAAKYIDDVVSGRLNYGKTFFNRFFKLMQRLYYNHELSGGCPAGRGQIAVSADGKIYPCTSFIGVKEFELGEVRHGLEYKAYRRFVEKANKRYEYCRQECELFSLCRSSGSCLNVNYFFNADPARPHKKSCALFREKLGLAAATLCILSDKIPHRVEKLFGFDPVGRRGNKLY